jgi:HSP20 family protein
MQLGSGNFSIKEVGASPLAGWAAQIICLSRHRSPTVESEYMPRRVNEWLWDVEQLRRLHEELNRSWQAVASGRCWEPRVDVLEDQRRVVIKAEIAGVRGEDIQLLYMPERHSLLIRGVRRDESVTDGDGQSVRQLEIMYGEFAREVPLPEVDVDPQSMRAQYRNGFLIVVIPKSENIVVTGTINVTSI